jgi:hypothetical protein
MAYPWTDKNVLTAIGSASRSKCVSPIPEW